MSKVLIAYYSRSGITRRVAEKIKARFKCDIEEIESVKDRSGMGGYLLCGKEATKKILADVGPTNKNPVNYDLVIVGTPVWAWTVSSPIRTYLTQNQGKIKKAAYFCTLGGSGAEKALAEMEKLSKVKPVATMTVLDKKVYECDKEVEEFLQKIKS